MNYGYISGVIGGDAYILDRSIDYPIESYCGEVIAVAVRDNDIETKWIVSN